jgi:CRP/FNR family transcriptional regulator
MPFDASPEAFSDFHAAQALAQCELCPVQGCMARQGAASGFAAAWAGMLAPRVALMPGEKPLFTVGERPTALYSVRAGCIKTFTLDADGNERIRAFYTPGDLVGLDALGGGRMPASAVAVVASQVCVAPLANVRRLIAQRPELAERLLAQTSRDLASALCLAGDYTAEQRMAAFLLQMSDRLPSLNGHLRLPMPQRDIGSHLRLATETVCRTLKTFQRRGLLISETQGLQIVKRGELRGIAGVLYGVREVELKFAA